MLDFPEKTFFNKPVPKAKFYEKLDVKPALKKVFVNQIEKIVWRNKLSPATLNVQPGTRIQEIQVFEISLKSSLLDEAALKLIDKGIPYHILFLLKHDDLYMACMADYNDGYAAHGECSSLPVQTRHERTCGVDYGKSAFTRFFHRFWPCSMCRKEYGPILWNIGKRRHQDEAFGLQSIRYDFIVDRRMYAIKRTCGKCFFCQAQGLLHATAKAMRL